MGWEAFAGWMIKNWSRLRPWITPVALASPRKPIPKETLRIVLNTASPPWWHVGKRGGEPATQIAAEFFATNITDEKILVVGGKLKPKGTEHSHDVQTHCKRIGDDKERTSTNRVSVHGFICPAIMQDGEILEAQIFLVDQFGNENPGPMTTFNQR